MIPLAEINSIAARLKVPAETIEKDYAVSWALNCIAKSKLKNDFAFYGGTAIKRIYFEDHRFSEDIDLISDKSFSSNYLAQCLIDSFVLAKKDTNLIFEIDTNRTISDESRSQMFMRYSGYDEIVGAPKEIRIDFAGDREKTGDTVQKKIIETYTDLKHKGHALTVQTLNTIFAVKLGLLTDSNRKEPRDVFDIWFLLNRLDQFDFSRERFREIFKEKYGYYPSLSALRSHLHNSTYSNRWETRLKKQIAELPEIDVVIHDIETRLEILFLDQKR